MATKEISDAIDAIPSKKAHLRKAFETLQSYSSSLASFTLQWQDLEDHFSSLERSIDARFKQLQSITPSSLPLPSEPSSAPADEPRPELKSFCTKMDSKGLWSYIIANRKQIPAIRSELTSAIRFAPDPDTFVLDAVENFYPSNQLKHMHLLDVRRTSIHLLEKIRLAVPEVGASARDKAKKIALKWKKKVEEGDGENSFEALGFLRLVLAYGLGPEIEADFLLDLLVRVSRRQDTVDLLRHLGLTEKASDFIQKLNCTGKNLDAVKFVYAFNLLDSYPPEPLLQAYLKQSRKAVQELRKKCNNSSQSEHDASSKEIAALKNVIKVVDECKLHKFSCDKLNKRIEQLEKQLEKHKADKKRAASSAVVSNLENQKQLHSNRHMQQLENQKQQQSNKRLRPSTITSQPLAATYQLSALHQNQPQLGIAERAPYLSSRLFPLTTSEYPYGRDLGRSGSLMMLGRNPTSLTPYSHSVESLASSGLYDRPVTYGGYSPSGMSSAYGASHYP